MALVKCLECGNQISEQANNCPKCGKPTESGTFKWQVYLFIAVVCPTIAFFVGYGNFCNDPVANRLWTKKYIDNNFFE